ncbi:hypothetical protein C1O30_20345 [Dickeya zeae]|nr:hypothetical protein C1O30_20345 [Dickeya zeae]
MSHECLAAIYTRHTSSCRCVGCPHSPQSLTCVSSWGFTRLPPSCNSNYLGYICVIFRKKCGIEIPMPPFILQEAYLKIYPWWRGHGDNEFGYFIRL